MKESKARVECQQCDWTPDWMDAPQANSAGREHLDSVHGGAGDFLTFTDDPPTVS